MKDFNDLYYFAKVVEFGGFSAASHELMVTKSLLSRRVAELENRLGVKLLNRNTRNLAITEVGKIYYQHCQAMIIEADAADAAIEMLSSEPVGIVKISCPVNLLHINMSQILNDFLTKFPKVRLHIEATNRKVDLVNEQYDIAIRVRPLPLKDSDLIVRNLSLSRQYIVASPELAYKHFSIQHPKQLNQWPILMMESYAPEYYWKLFNQDNEQYLFKCEPRLTTTDLVALHSATLQGLGIAKLPALIVEDELKQGRLVKVIADWEPKPEMVHIVYTSRRGLLPSVKALIDFLVTAFEHDDKQP